MVTCSAFGCTNRTSKRTPGVTFHRIVTRLAKFRDDYLVLESWKQSLFQLLKIPNTVPYEPDIGESPAVEVMKYNIKDEYFGMSLNHRTFRSPDVRYHIGQVIRHKHLNFKGVIIGWNENAKAPQDYIDELDSENKEWKNKPIYAILVDTRDKLIPQLTYIPQDNIEIIESTKIIHPLVDTYFEHFNGVQYIPRPWLQTVYPHD